MLDFLFNKNVDIEFSAHVKSSWKTPPGGAHNQKDRKDK